MSDFTLGKPDAGAYFSDRYVAWALGKSQEFVQRMCRSKQWPHMQVGKSYRFKAEHISAIEALSEVKTAETPGKAWGLAPGSRAAS